MRLKKGLIQHQVVENSMWIPTGRLSEKFNGMLRSNETAAFLLEHLCRETTQEALTEALLEAYDVERDRAAKDVADLIKLLEQEGLLE